MPIPRILPAPLALFMALVLPACGPTDQEGLYRARRAELERRNQGLRELIAEAGKGSLLPPDRFMVGVDESLADALFDAQLPLEETLKGLVVVRLEDATFRFREKYGTVGIESRIRLRAVPLAGIAVRIQGGLAAAEIDPQSGVLRVQIAIDHVGLVAASGIEGLLGRGVMNFLGDQVRSLLEQALPPLEIPVRVEEAIPIPALEEGGVHLSALEVPLEVAVERVLAAGGKLWVMFDASVGAVSGADGGLGVEIDQAKPKEEPS